jgi:hypothetical protein
VTLPLLFPLTEHCGLEPDSGEVESVTESNDLWELTGGEKLSEDLVESAPQLTLEGDAWGSRRC